MTDEYGDGLIGRIDALERERDRALDKLRAQAAQIERLRANVRGWVEWHRRCDADDDCTYLNDNAWCDADALASTGMGLLARAILERGGR